MQAENKKKACEQREETTEYKDVSNKVIIYVILQFLMSLNVKQTYRFARKNNSLVLTVNPDRRPECLSR